MSKELIHRAKKEILDLGIRGDTTYTDIYLFSGRISKIMTKQKFWFGIVRRVDKTIYVYGKETKENIEAVEVILDTLNELYESKKLMSRVNIVPMLSPP